MIIEPLNDIVPPSPADTLPDYERATQPAEAPPRYLYTQARPSQPITYTFTPWSSDPDSIGGSTLLLPPATIGIREQPYPLYRISTNLNLNAFLPLSHVTQLHRSDTGQLIGRFEVSLYKRRGVLTMGDTTARIVDVLSTINASTRHWRWIFDETELRWDCRTDLDDGSPMCICYSSISSAAHSAEIQLASFIPPPPNAPDPLPPAILTVFPHGHADGLLDHIVLSALVVVRMLCTPA